MMPSPTKDFGLHTAIFSVLVVFILIGSLIMSYSAKYNPIGALKGDYTPDFAYSLDDSREMVSNTCKFPYIFLSNDDVIDGHDYTWGDCFSNELTSQISISPEGVLKIQRTNKQLGSQSLFDLINCTYYKHSGISNNLFEINPDKPVKIPFYNFAVACKHEGIVDFLKPFVNFGVLPKETVGQSVAILFLPSVNHKRFMKTMTKTKHFMLEHGFSFSRMSMMKNPKPFEDLLIQLGISSELNVFQKAKIQNFTTFYMGPQQIRDLIEVNYDNSAHRNFVYQFLIDDNKCLKDGRRFVEDQIERFQSFLLSTNNSKFFSTFFLDDFGAKKRVVDLDLSTVLETLEEKGVFKNTTLIISSYDLSDSPVETEDDKNPLLAVRISDTLKNEHPLNRSFLSISLSRALTTVNTYQLILNLLDPSSMTIQSPYSNVLSAFSTCESLQIPNEMCLCMKSSFRSEFPIELEKNFIATIKETLREEVKKSKCAKILKIDEKATFYSYTSEIKGNVNLVELSGTVSFQNPNDPRLLPVRKTFVFEPMFESFRSFDSTRIAISYGVHVGIASLCYV